MKPLSEFKNIHNGKRVFIIGNGPSLTGVDLDLLDGEYSIAMNRISRVYSSTRWRPSFFVCTTSNIEDPSWRVDILDTVRLGIPTFVWEELEEHFDGIRNVYPLKCLNGHEVTDNAPMEWWSDDIESHVTKFGTSMIVAFQLVVYMGFKEIVLLGADLGFKDSVLQKIFYRVGLKQLGHNFDSNHFFGSYGTPGFPASVLNSNMLAAHRLTKKACDARGVRVYNASPETKLNLYPRVNLRLLFDR